MSQTPQYKCDVYLLEKIYNWLIHYSTFNASHLLSKFLISFHYEFNKNSAVIRDCFSVDLTSMSVPIPNALLILLLSHPDAKCNILTSLCLLSKTWIEMYMFLPLIMKYHYFIHFYVIDVILKTFTIRLLLWNK